MTPNELRASFYRALQYVREGKGVVTETGLDEHVESALQQLAFDPFDAEALRMAHDALGRQISGESGRQRATVMRMALSYRQDGNG